MRSRILNRTDCWIATPNGSDPRRGFLPVLSLISAAFEECAALTHAQMDPVESMQRSRILLWLDGVCNAGHLSHGSTELISSISILLGPFEIGIAPSNTVGPRRLVADNRFGPGHAIDTFI
eukprot:5006227-Amphidinium_carterae.1